MLKIRKNSEKKALQTDGQTRGWMNRAEFTGPEGWGFYNDNDLNDAVLVG